MRLNESTTLLEVASTFNQPRFVRLFAESGLPACIDISTKTSPETVKLRRGHFAYY